MDTKDDYGKDKVSDAIETPQKVKSIPRPPPPFPQRIKKKEKEGTFNHFFSRLKQLSIKILLIEALQKMQGYVNYMQNLVAKKCTMSQALS